MPDALDLFCGAGGASLGLHLAGYSVTAIDKWKDALDTHALNGMPCFERDISTITGTDWITSDRSFDLVWASPPCQGWSQGGKHLGTSDPRNGFPWALRAVKYLRSRVVIFENVKGLVNKTNRPYFENEVMTELGALGYNAEWRLLNCADYGIPQKRKRLFVVARFDGTPQWPTSTHAEDPDPDDLDIDPWVTMAKALNWPGQHLVGFPRRADGLGKIVVIDGVAYRERDLTPSDQPSNTLTEKARSWKVYPEWAYLEPAPTVSTTFGGVGGRRPAGGHRNLLLEEAQILQGFPKGFHFSGSKTSAFLQVGNAVPPKMAELLASANKA